MGERERNSQLQWRGSGTWCGTRHRQREQRMARATRKCGGAHGLAGTVQEAPARDRERVGAEESKERSKKKEKENEKNENRPDKKNWVQAEDNSRKQFQITKIEVWIWNQDLK